MNTMRWGDMDVEDVPKPQDDGFKLVERKKKNKKKNQDTKNSITGKTGTRSVTESKVWDTIKTNKYCLSILDELPSEFDKFVLIKAFENYEQLTPEDEEAKSFKTSWETEDIPKSTEELLQDQVQTMVNKGYDLLKAFKSTGNWFRNFVNVAQ